ncbi:hypothetical protein ABW20_dc0109295 [Dactylellina cionopaga]|nr:hypothetical protein ABW20_dc0109295 [Dactylellina cionopaga]
MKIYTLLGPLAALSGLVNARVIKRACDHCSSGGHRRNFIPDTGSDPAIPAVEVIAPKAPTIDLNSTPVPSKDNCLRQLEEYGTYADPRCDGFGNPVDLINSYRGLIKAAQA